MAGEAVPPDFADFTTWLAAKLRNSTSSICATRFAELVSAARAARDETLRAQLAATDVWPAQQPTGPMEVLQLLAAADKFESTKPPELTTARGFRVTLAYDEGRRQLPSSICVLVHCPSELIAAVQGETVYLWNGSERFELGQFDSEGKAIGTLPAGIEISLSDFAMGKVQLEEPPAATDQP